MKTKSFLTPLLIPLALVAATISTLFLGRLLLNYEQAPAPGLPPLSHLDLPLQTMNGFTAQLESYYAVASRLVFVVRVNISSRQCFYLWTVSTNQCDALIHAHENQLTSLAWSPDGSQLATGGGVIRLWEAQTGKPVTALGLSDRSTYTKLAWLKPDLLISLEPGYGSDTPTIVRFWDLASGKTLLEFDGQSGSFGN